MFSKQTHPNFFFFKENFDTRPPKKMGENYDTRPNKKIKASSNEDKEELKEKEDKIYKDSRIVV